MVMMRHFCSSNYRLPLVGFWQPKNTQHNIRVEKKRKREAAPYKCDTSMHFGRPETVLEPVHVMDGLLVDNNWEYTKKITHLHSWQFFLLAECLKDLIERIREQPVTKTRTNTEA
jgi:hypothetical protein